MQEPESIDINIGKYLEVLVRQWQLIFAAALLGILIASFYSLPKPRVYRAQTLVASTKMASAVSFETGIETLTEEQLGYKLSSTNTRLLSFVEMVRNPAIARAVIDKLDEQLSEEDHSIVRLMSRVKGSIAGKSDSIQIEVTHTDPDQAEAIANAWSEAYVNHVNTVYSGGVNATYRAIQNQNEAARAKYEDAQASLADFLGENRVQELAREIAEQQAVIDNLSAARTLMVNTVVSNTMVAQLTVFDEQINNLEERLDLAYSESRLITQWLKDAQDMRDQVLTGGSGAASSNALALYLLKAQIFAGSNRETRMADAESEWNASSVQFQAGPLSMTQEEMVEDLNSLIRTLEARQIALTSEIGALSQQLLESGDEIPASSLNASEGVSGPGIGAEAPMRAFAGLNGLDDVLASGPGTSAIDTALGSLESRVNELESLSAIETSREQELTRARDLAWETYSALSAKEAELKVAAEARGTEVVLAVPATVSNASSSRINREVQIAAAAGLTLGVIAAFLIESWWRYKGLEPTAISILPRRKKREGSSRD